MKNNLSEILSLNLSSKNETIGDRISKALQHNNMNRVQLEQLTNIDHNLIRKYQVGYRIPVDENLQAISKALNVDYNWLKYGSVSFDMIDAESYDFILQYHNIPIEKYDSNYMSIDDSLTIVHDISFYSNNIIDSITQLKNNGDDISLEKLKTIYIILNAMNNKSVDNVLLDHITFRWMCDAKNINEYYRAIEDVSTDRVKSLNKFFKEYVFKWCGVEHAEKLNNLTFQEKRNIFDSLAKSYDSIVGGVGIDFPFAHIYPDGKYFICADIDLGVSIDSDEDNVVHDTFTVSVSNYEKLNDAINQAIAEHENKYDDNL